MPDLNNLSLLSNKSELYDLDNINKDECKEEKKIKIKHII